MPFLKNLINQKLKEHDSIIVEEAMCFMPPWRNVDGPKFPHMIVGPKKTLNPLATAEVLPPLGPERKYLGQSRIPSSGHL